MAWENGSEGVAAGALAAVFSGAGAGFGGDEAAAEVAAGAVAAGAVVALAGAVVALAGVAAGLFTVAAGAGAAVATRVLVVLGLTRTGRLVVALVAAVAEAAF
jgi:hypothetical protein